MPILQTPSSKFVAQYIAALKRGYSPNNLNADEAAKRELGQLETDETAFLTSIDGTLTQQQAELFQRGKSGRLPGYRRWLMRDDDFLGSFGFRWAPNSAELPASVPGHIGYSIVRWEQNKGYAKFGLKALLMEIQGVGLPYFELSIEESNQKSIAVARACGAFLHETIPHSKFYPNCTEHRYRISSEL